LARKFAAIGYLRRTVEEAMALDPSERARERLEEMYDVNAIIERGLEEVIDRWNGRKGT